MSNQTNFHFGLVGDSDDAVITAYGSAAAMGVPCEGEAQKAWTCNICTFHNTETLGRFCSMCGSARLGNQPPESNEQKNSRDNAPSQIRDSVYTESERLDTLGDLPAWGSSNQHKNRHAPKEDDLEGSFSFLSLVEDSPVVSQTEPARPSLERAPTLCEKEFQMSFANWSISDNGAWTCAACTFVNTNALHLTCEVCGQKRPTKKHQGQQSQKVMQDMFETSFRTGQHDFLRRQQDKIEEVEHRAIANERVHEIMALQTEMMEEFKGGESKVEDTHALPQGRDIVNKAQQAKEYIDQLEEVRRKEQQEQRKMEEILNRKRRELGMTRMSTERILATPAPRQQVKPQTAESQVRAQERLLSQWKQKTRSQEPDLEAIRRRQQAIFDKLQGGL